MASPEIMKAAAVAAAEREGKAMTETVSIKTAQDRKGGPFTIDLERLSGQPLFAWCIRLGINDQAYGKHYGAFLTPFQALELAGELTKMAAEQMEEYTEGAERELETLRKRAESEEW